ncbi:sacsin N-terminal ATP-binding-like domain-containing protein, partial [Actinosynnema sp. NPDC059797]
MDSELAPDARGGPLTPEAAADLLFQDPKEPIDFVAADEVEARRAVERFAQLFADAPGVFRQALDGAKSGAQALSGDRFQGLVEIIQNADDVGASQVEFRIADRRLVATHNGREATLSDVLALATPWLSSKADDASATGRFGIGLMTLRAISDVIEVHSGHYHVRLGEPTIAATEAPPPSTDTAFCLPLRDDAINTDQLVSWLDRWNDSALLFLRHVERIRVLGSDSVPVRTLELTWSDQVPASWSVGDQELTVRRRQAWAADGRTWLVHSVHAAAPPGVERHNKATDATIPLGLALSLHVERGGFVYAGLPLVQTSAPVRVHAQFDPVASRTGLAATAWNKALLPLIADLWVEIVADLFAQRPDTAWTAVPLPDETDIDAADPLIRVLETLLLDRARTRLATDVALTIDGTAVPLAELAVEEPQLSSVLEPSEVARLAGTARALPDWARDSDDRWRRVLEDWAHAGADLPPPVTMQDALILLSDPDRTPTATIRLTAAALDARLADELAELPCVVTATGDRLVPPEPKSLRVLLATGSPLAEQVGMGVRLASEHLAEDVPARTVLAWLRRIEAVLDGAAPEQVVRRLAAAGNAGRSFENALSDDQLKALRDAFEQLPVAQRPVLGAGVGKAIRIDAYSYDVNGHPIHLAARPVDVYLSRSIDREPASFAFAAHLTTGLLWTAARYAEQLRSTLGRGTGLGPQKFLGLLGVERAPRLIPHWALERRFGSDPRLGLPAACGPTERTAEMRRQGATYTLEDSDSPDLHAVARSIARERKASVRRQRASALLAVLARSWSRLREEAQVDTAADYYSWQLKGSTRAHWLWTAGAIAWLDDTSGKPKAPRALRVKTPATIAVHGPDAAGYARSEADPTRREVLAALGVAGEPSTGDLVGRLYKLRDGEPATDAPEVDAAIVYQALADRLGRPTPVAGDLTTGGLRSAFAEPPGLVFTNLGWRPPADVLLGSPVFHNRRAFVPQV